MATVPSAATYTAGSRWKASDVNQLTSTDKSFFLAPPICSVYATVATTMTAAGTLYPVAFDSEVVDNDAMHSTSSNTSRLTVVTAGYYLISGVASMNQQAAVSYLHAGISKNAATPDHLVGTYIPTTPSTNYSVTATRILYLVAGDYVELRVRCGTAGATTIAAAGGRSYLEARWIGTGP